MLLISFWQVLMFLIAFLSLKQAKNEEELGIIHGKARLKLNYMKNPSFGDSPLLTTTFASHNISIVIAIAPA